MGGWGGGEVECEGKAWGEGEGELSMGAEFLVKS